MSPAIIEALVRSKFVESGIQPTSVELRRFPGETIVIVEVATQFEKAVSVGSSLDNDIEDGFVTVRFTNTPSGVETAPVGSVRDQRVTKLIEMLDTRSRTSEAQPSLRYLEDVDGRLQVARGHRHHLIFGRRGVGKTALLLETKSLVEREGGLSIWINIQTVRNLGCFRAFLTVVGRICDLVVSTQQHRKTIPRSLRLATQVATNVQAQLDSDEVDSSKVESLLSEVQQLLTCFTVELQSSVFLFLDDIHYLPYREVPRFLDMIHGITRDTTVWIKAAGIKHQMRWFVSEPPTGLQIGHDAIEINLDITLQEPERAKEFLQSVLDAYIDECQATPRKAFLSNTALDRLVLASGGVPRDFVTLSASALQSARKRENARAAGVQDVNNAAGLAAKAKIQELEEDAATDQGGAKLVLESLSFVRDFLLDSQQKTFFLVDFADKEGRSREYAIIQKLMDLRMLHLINGSLSDGKRAGKRYEVYLLDLSQYSGARLKRELLILDFSGGHLILKKTGSRDSPQVASSSLNLVSILRRGAHLELSTLSKLLDLSS